MTYLEMFLSIALASSLLALAIAVMDLRQAQRDLKRNFRS